MRKLKEFGLYVAPAAVGLIAPVIALAVGLPAPAGVTIPSQLNDVSQIFGTTAQGIICSILLWVFWLLIVLVILFVLIAAFKYLTSGGEPEKVKAASHMLLYAAVAVVVALLAKGLPTLVGNFVGGGTPGTVC